MTKKRVLKVALLCLGLALIALTVRGLSLADTVNLLPLQPVPAYLKIFPEPGQAVYLLAASQIEHIPSWGIPGYVCAELDPESLMQPGDYFESEIIQRTAMLEIDGQTKETPSVFSYDLGLTRTYPDGRTATTGGPFIICWQGPISIGRHSVIFTFRDQSYSWWYELR